MKPEVLNVLENGREFDVLVLFLWEEEWEKAPIFQTLNIGSGKLLEGEAADCRFTAKRNQLVAVSTRGCLPYKRIFLFGVGKKEDFANFEFRKAGALCARTATKLSAKTVCFVLPDDLRANAYGGSGSCQLYLGLLLAGYRFTRYKSDTTDLNDADFKSSFVLGEAGVEELGALESCDSLAAAIKTARDWVNEPAAVLSPLTLSQKAVEWLGQAQVETNVLDREGLEKEKMGMVLAVGKGSEVEPCLIHGWYRSKNAKKKVILVGKGVTFDSGGYSLKPSDSMKDMKGDMAGAALVLSALRLVAETKLDLEVHAIAPCAENMVSGGAYRLGDVLQSRSGKTVEITNTDAEGRLLLADALDYACELKPDLVIDFATLTGACVVALGPFMAGVMGSDKVAVEEWLSAAKRVGEEMWHLPLPENLKDQLKSDVADLRNAGDRWGGALTAGLFLKEFVGKTPWFHVDIAGPAFADKESGEYSRGGTGFGIATLFEFLKVLSTS